MPKGNRKTAPERAEAAAAFAGVVATLARLRGPDGCPWDREQTLASIKPHTLEEVYEVFDAIDRSDWNSLQDELGDLLLQVLFYAQMAEDEERFSIADVIASLQAKLIRRHPHVFGTEKAETAIDVASTWERVKNSERLLAGQATGLLDPVASAMPAWTEARKLTRLASSVGFDWPATDGIFDKVAEEAAELRAEVAPGFPAVAGRVEEEFGDLLFTLANLARHLEVDPEQALRKANRKFRRRFNQVEKRAGAKPLPEHTPAELEVLWTAAKRGGADG